MQKTTFDDFEIIRTLGQGAFSTVFLVKRKQNNKQYALKSIKMENLSKTEQQNSVNEIRILSSIVHPNIIAYKESFWNWKNKTLNIIMEYCDDGDLETKIKKMQRNKIKFNENLIWNYAFQILFGIKALHDKGVIHRDLKSANIFLTRLNNKCKIGDLNTGKVIKNNKNKNNVNCQIGTPSYFSPEIWKKEEITYKSDIWAFGCIVYEMCCLRMPFKGKNMKELKENICKGKFEKISSRYSKELWEFIQTLLESDSEKRPNCDMILESQIVKDKLKQISEFKNLNNEKNDDESSIADTIEYINLWDLENKIPIKRKYTKTNMINNNGEETIRNDSSFYDITCFDLDKNNNKEQKNKRQKNDSFKNNIKNQTRFKQNNIIKNFKKELILTKDFLKINEYKSFDCLSFFGEKFKLKEEKLDIKKNKSYSYYIGVNSKRINKNNYKNKEVLTKKNKSELISVKKEIISNENKNNPQTGEKNIEQKKNILNKMEKQPNYKIKKENNKKNQILKEINTTSSFQKNKKENIKYNYTNYKMNKDNKLSMISYQLSLRNKTKIFHNINPKFGTNNTDQLNKIKKLETSDNNTFRKQNNNKTFNDFIFKKKEKSFHKDNKIRIDIKTINTYMNKPKNGNDEFSNKNKIKKKDSHKSIKQIIIDLNDFSKNNYKINLRKSVEPLNPFKINNDHFISGILHKTHIIKKANINISSKQVNYYTINKNKQKW